MNNVAYNSVANHTQDSVSLRVLPVLDFSCGQFERHPVYS